MSHAGGGATNSAVPSASRPASAATAAVSSVKGAVPHALSAATSPPAPFVAAGASRPQSAAQQRSSRPPSSVLPRQGDSPPSAAVNADAFAVHEDNDDDGYDDLAYPLKELSRGAMSRQQHHNHQRGDAVRSATSRIGTAFTPYIEAQQRAQAAAAHAATASSSRPVSARVVVSSSQRPGSAPSGPRPPTAASTAAGGGKRPVSSAFFTGMEVRPASPTHVPTRPDSLAFKPFLSHSTACLVEHNAKYDFRTATGKTLNADLVIQAHRELSLREPIRDEAPLSSSTVENADELTPRERRAANRELEARRRRDELQSRLAVNMATRDVVNTPRSVVEATIDAVLPSGNHSTVDGIRAEQAKAKLRAYVRENHFRVNWRTPRNDDLRLSYTARESLKCHEQPYVPPDKLFQYRVPEAQLTAAMEDADDNADRARPAHASRPETPRSVSRFFTSADSSTSFEGQDLVYAEQLRLAVRTAVAKAEHRAAPSATAYRPVTADFETTTQAPQAAVPQPPAASRQRPLSARSAVSAAGLAAKSSTAAHFKSSRPTTARQQRTAIDATALAEHGMDAELERRGVSVHTWLRGLSRGDNHQS